MGTIDFCLPASLLGHAKVLPGRGSEDSSSRSCSCQSISSGRAHPAPPLNHCNHIARSGVKWNGVDGCLRRAFDELRMLLCGLRSKTKHSKHCSKVSIALWHFPNCLFSTGRRFTFYCLRHLTHIFPLSFFWKSVHVNAFAEV